MSTGKGLRVVLLSALACVLALTGCTAEPQAVVSAPSLTMAPTTESPTTRAVPTATLRPTDTVAPWATATDAPTATRTRTATKTATHTETPTPTLTPSATPTQPPVTLQGRFFFDKNGSGLRDREDENGLVGYRVCALGTCVATGEDGAFVLELPGDSGATVHLTFDDPNKGNPALEMRYINEWKGPVVIPAYTMNGVDVPEQHLNDTRVVRLSEGADVESGAPSAIGLMQGFLTLPFRCADLSQVGEWYGFDHDPREGSVLSYLGDTVRSFNPGEPGTGDNHAGDDFGIPEGEFVVAPLQGIMTNEFVNQDNGSRVGRIEDRDLVDRQGHFVVVVFAHHSVPLVEGVPSEYSWSDFRGVYRGQIVALSGMTGTGWPHLHFGYAGNPLISTGPFEAYDPFGVQYSTTIASDRYSAWTVYNSPVCSD